MKTTWIVLSVGLLSFSPCLQIVSRAQDQNCSKVITLRKIVQAKSVVGLTELERKAGQNYQLQVAFAARRLELDPKSQAAASSFLDRWVSA